MHWSYWSSASTPYDSFAIGAWRRASVCGGPPEEISPFTLRLVRSAEVLSHLARKLCPLTVEWLHATARSVERRPDGLYGIHTSAGVLLADWVFDSAPGLAPEFPASGGPRAVLSGPGLHVRSDLPVFDAETATLFDPLDERSFVYLLPLTPSEALVESASFGPEPVGESPEPLLDYLRGRYPAAGFEVLSAEYGSIPLGFAPRETAGPRHILLGAKRGLVKPSAGYGVVNIARESQRLARLWREGSPLPPGRRPDPRWRALDAGFLGLAARDPRLPMLLLGRVMRGVPLADSLSFIDETLAPRRLPPLVASALPALLGR